MQALGIEEFVRQGNAIAVVIPCVHLAGVQAEGHGGCQCIGRILAPVVIAGGVARLDRACGGGVGGLQAGDQFTGGKDLDGEVAIGRGADVFRQRFGGAIDGIQRLGEG
jgi:hypothetical protein